MNNSDKHTWSKTEEGHICKTCGCVRTTEYLGKFSTYYYERSGIMFFDKRPDCLDWDDNTLD